MYSSKMCISKTYIHLAPPQCSAILCLGCCYIGELLHLEEDATVDGLQAYVRLLITSSVCFYLFP